MSFHDVAVLALVVCFIVAFGVAVYYRRQARRLQGSMADFNRRVVDTAEKLVVQIQDEVRAAAARDYTPAEYNRGYRQALKDIFAAGFPVRRDGPDMSWRGGFQSFSINGHSLAEKEDGRLTLRES